MEFFKWMNTVPGPIHPSYDTTGEYAAVGQQGKVWFLYGVAFAPLLDPPALPVQRRCTIPAGTAVFLHLRGTFWTTLPADLDENGQPTFTEEEAFAVLKEIEDVTSDLTCEIDGKPVQNLQSYRCHTPAFNYTFADLPPGETWWDYGWPDWLVPSGGWVSKLSIWDGYALLLAPLSAGEHTIRRFVPHF